MRSINRVAMISVHTSPLDQPGTGDAGGLNVYVLELARELAELGVQTDVFTRATSSTQEPVVRAAEGVLVRRVAAGPFEGLSKEQLPAQSCHFVREVLRVEATHLPNRYDAIHSHYWLSGQVGAVARDRWGVPLIHTMHTTARVKNKALADGDTPEPHFRELGEQQVVEAADRLIANTGAEAEELVRLYDADPHRVDVVHPGVDLTVFRPQDRRAVRTRLGIDAQADVVMFVGRLQALKAPDVLLRAVAVLLQERPQPTRPPGRPGGGRTVRHRPRAPAGSDRPGTRPRDRRRRALRPRADAGRARRLVRRRVPRLRPFAQRDLRSGGAGGPGQRHPGDRRPCRRPHDGRARRAVRPPRRRSPPPRVGACRRGPA
jgi:glycosyltransferase involved in cell wall biosynthesis